MNKAKIENGVVTNIIAVDPANIPSWCYNWPTATEDAEIGGTYANGVFTRIPRPPAPEEPAPVPASISFAQLLIGLVTEQWITSAEGRAWRDRVALPAQVQTLIASLPVEQQFAAETRAMAPSEVLRNDPLVVAMGAASGKTEEEMDDFFRTYSQV